VLVTIYHSHFRYPKEGGAIRSYHLAKKLLHEGHQVQVVAQHNEFRGFRTIDGIPVHYLNVKYSNSYGFNRRVISFTIYLIRATLFLIRNQSDLNYVISVPLTNGLLGILGKKLKSTPYIFEVGDLWPDVPREMGIIRNKLLIKTLLAFEKIVYLSAKKVVALSPPMKKVIEEKIETSRGDLYSQYVRL